jgi:quercetin dioxygenase-like cupin family protein
MRSRFPFLAAPVLAVLAVGAVFEQPTAAQYGRRSSAGPDQLEWENNRVRLRRIAVDPGATADAGAAADRVLVYLTADQDGRMPEAEAVWQGAGSGALQNRGNARLEAIAIELKGGTSEGTGGTPPEAFSLSYRVDVRRLIDNPRVLVTKHRYAPATYTDPLHFHSEDMLVVYLRGGYTWPALGWGAYRVRRGEFDVIPANSLHTLGNAGSDPLEFLVILPR